MKRYRQVLDYVVATVSVGDLLLQFVKGGGDFQFVLLPRMRHTIGTTLVNT